MKCNLYSGNDLLVQQPQPSSSGSLVNPSPTISLDDLYSNLTSNNYLPRMWTDFTPKPEEKIEAIKLCKINPLPSSSTQPPVITHSLVINTNLSWKLIIHGHVILPASTDLLSKLPEYIDTTSLSKLFSIV